MENWNRKHAKITYSTHSADYLSSANLQIWAYIGIVITVIAVFSVSDSPRNRIKKKKYDALHLMRTSPRELDWSPMILNGNDRCVMGDNNFVELRWGTSAKMLQLRPGAKTLDSCWLGILLHPVTYWLNSSYSAMVERVVQGNRTSILTMVIFEPTRFFRNKKRKVSNCPLFSAEIMTWNVSWQVSPSRCSREKEKGKITRWIPGEISFLTSEWLDQFIIRHVSKAGGVREFTQLASNTTHWRICVIQEKEKWARVVG